MTLVGIEAMNAFGGSACLNVEKLARHRNLDMTRFTNLLMKEKTIALPYEDPITFGVNAARPLIDAMSPEEKDRIEMVITCTESAFDFGKSMSTYFHKLLGLNRNCRLFEMKNACYSGVAGFQMAVNFVLSQVSPGAKVLVIATDLSRFTTLKGGEALTQDLSFFEPSAGAGAVAMIVGENPYVFQVDVGANGYYGYEVMDTCRPLPEVEAGDPDLSLLSFLDCCEKSFLEYKKRVEGVDFVSTIDHGDVQKPQRVGCFSYGSGCCAEFFSGVVTSEGQDRVRAMRVKDQLDKRYELTMEEYDSLLVNNNAVKFGTRNVVSDIDFIPQARSAQGAETLFLTEIKEFHRQYESVC